MDLSHTVWRKASYSGPNGGNCVEVATWRKASKSNSNSNGGACVEVARDLPGVVAVRDSKNPDGPRLVLSPAGWQSFTGKVKAGRFDVA